MTRWSMLSPRSTSLTVNRAALLDGLPDRLTSRRRFAPFAGNDDVKIRSRDACAPELCSPRSHEAIRRSGRSCFDYETTLFDSLPAIKGKAERRKARCPNQYPRLARLRAATGSAPPFGAHACGTRHRLLPRWLSSRTGFPAAAANRCFACFPKRCRG